MSRGRKVLACLAAGVWLSAAAAMQAGAGFGDAQGGGIGAVAAWFGVETDQITAPTDNQALTYDSATGGLAWETVSVSEADTLATVLARGSTSTASGMAIASVTTSGVTVTSPTTSVIGGSADFDDGGNQSGVEIMMRVGTTDGTCGIATRNRLGQAYPCNIARNEYAVAGGFDGTRVADMRWIYGGSSGVECGIEWRFANWNGAAWDALPTSTMRVSLDGGVDVGGLGVQGLVAGTAVGTSDVAMVRSAAGVWRVYDGSSASGVGIDEDGEIVLDNGSNQQVTLSCGADDTLRVANILTGPNDNVYLAEYGLSMGGSGVVRWNAATGGNNTADLAMGRSAADVACLASNIFPGATTFGKIAAHALVYETLTGNDTLTASESGTTYATDMSTSATYSLRLPDGMTTSGCHFRILVIGPATVRLQPGSGDNFLDAVTALGALTNGEKLIITGGACSVVEVVYDVGATAWVIYEAHGPALSLVAGGGS